MVFAISVRKRRRQCLGSVQNAVLLCLFIIVMPRGLEDQRCHISQDSAVDNFSSVHPFQFAQLCLNRQGIVYVISS